MAQAVRRRRTPRRRWLFGAALAAILGADPAVRAAGRPDRISVEPRVVEVSLDRVSLDGVDLSMRVALRSSHAATLKAIAFSDAFVGRVPVWIAPVSGHWPLESGHELVLPQAMQVRLQARDAVGAAELGTIVRKGAVTVRANVEIAVATPWVARLLFRGATRTLVREIVLDVPVRTGPAYLTPLARATADVADAAQRGAAAWLASGLDRLTGRATAPSAVGGRVAGVTTRYVVAGSGSPETRERRAAAFWWSATVVCTTREALEPWRFDVADATALQVCGARLQHDRGRVRIAATRDHAGVELDAAALEAVLPPLEERKLYALVDGRPERLRLGRRDATSNLACVRVADSPAQAGAAAVAASTPPTESVLAFAPGTPSGLAWTGIASADDGRLQLATPLHRASFGSPLVRGDEVVGLVASATTAWPAAMVAAAAARAPHVAPRPER